MLIFKYTPNGIAVIRPTAKGKKAEGIGRLRRVGEWLWDQNTVGREIYRTMENSEKRDLIGMIDALNGEIPRSISDMKRRWEEIIGPVTVELLSSDNVDWSAPISPMDR